MDYRATPNKTIIFDVDGVLADFVRGFTELAGVPEPWSTRENTAQWSFRDKIAPEVVSATWDKIKNSYDFWQFLPALVGRDTFNRINTLQAHNHVLFVTARVSHHNAQLQTIRFLQYWGVRLPNVVVSHKKGEVAAAVGAHYHIDDKPENAACVHWMADKQPCRSYFLETAVSKGQWLPQNVRRVATVDEFINDILEDK